MLYKQRKAELLKDGSYKAYQVQKREIYIASEKDLNTTNEALKILYGHDAEALTCFHQMQEARKKQRKNIKQHLMFWIKSKPEQHRIYFCTFTYDDAKVKTTDEKSLKHRVIREITNFVEDFILNVDYGEQNERMHFHALVLVDEKHLKGEPAKVKTLNHGRWQTIKNQDFDFLETYKKNTGNVICEEVKTGTEDVEKLSRYMDKLVLHSVKVKQTYISTKKGSAYQKKKKLNEALEEYSNHSKAAKIYGRGLLTEDYKEVERQIFLS